MKVTIDALGHSSHTASPWCRRPLRPPTRPPHLERCGQQAELDHAAIISLHEMFEDFAEMHKGQPMLSKESLSKLMDRLQHHEDEIELNCIMNEWDVDHDHHLTFDAFVSIVSK